MSLVVNSEAESVRTIQVDEALMSKRSGVLTYPVGAVQQFTDRQEC